MIFKTLYSQSRAGQLLQWQIEIDENKFRTIEGVVGGILTTGDWTICKGKNLEKKNETSATQQCIKEVEAKIAKKIKTKYYENIEDASQGKKYFEAAGCLVYEDYKDKLSGPQIIQAKLDGIKNIAKKTGCFSKEGNRFYSVPHIELALQKFFLENPDAVIDGELYNHDLKENFNEIVSLVKKVKVTEKELTESRAKIKYYIYDIYFPDKPDLNYSQRWDLIKKNFDNIEGLVVLDYIITDASQINENLLNKYLEQKYEGIVIKNPLAPYQHGKTKNLLKYKKFIDAEYKIVDFLDGRGKRMNLATKVVCETKDGIIFEAGVNGNNDFCRELYLTKEDYIGKFATIVYQNLTPDGKPRFGKMKSIRDYE